MECYCIWQGGRNEGSRALLLFSLFFSPLSLAALAPESLCSPQQEQPPCCLSSKPALPVIFWRFLLCVAGDLRQGSRRKVTATRKSPQCAPVLARKVKVHKLGRNQPGCNSQKEA